MSQFDLFSHHSDDLLPEVNKVYLEPLGLNFIRKYVQGIFESENQRIMTLCECSQGLWRSRFCSCKDWGDGIDCEHQKSLIHHSKKRFGTRSPGESFAKSNWFILMQKWHVDYKKLSLKVRLPSHLQMSSADGEFLIHLKSNQLAQILQSSFWGVLHHIDAENARKLRLSAFPQSLDWDQLHARTLNTEELNGYSNPEVNSGLDLEQSLLFSFLKCLMFYIPAEQRHKLSRSGEYLGLSWSIEGGLGTKP